MNLGVLMLASIPLLLALTFSQAQAVCPTNAATLKADVEKTTTAYSEWAWEAFDQGIVTVRSELGCLTDVPPTRDIRQIHLLFALAGARHQDLELARSAFRGLLASDSTYAPDAVMAPEGSILRRAFDEARAGGSPAGRSITTGTWFVDGLSSPTQIPEGRTVLVQLQEGTSFLTWYLEGKALPEGILSRLSKPVVTATVVPTSVVPPIEHPNVIPNGSTPSAEDTHGPRASRGLLVSGLAVAAVGVGSLAWGDAYGNKMNDTDDESTARKYYQTGFAATLAGLGLGVAGGGLVVGAVVKGQW